MCHIVVEYVKRGSITMNKAYPSDLTNKEWQILKEYIPPAKHGGRPRKHDVREIINAIMYRMRTGCQWRQLPKDFPPCKTVFDYFRKWSLDGTWENLHNNIRGLARKKNERRKPFCLHN